MNRKIIFILFQLYIINKETKSEYAITKRNRYILPNLQLLNKISTEEPKHLDNDSKEIIKFHVFDMYKNAKNVNSEDENANGDRTGLETNEIDNERKSRDLINGNQNTKPLSSNLDNKDSIKDTKYSKSDTRNSSKGPERTSIFTQRNRRSIESKTELIEPENAVLYSRNSDEGPKDSKELSVNLKSLPNIELNTNNKARNNQDSKYSKDVPDLPKALTNQAAKRYKPYSYTRHKPPDPKKGRCLTGYMTDVQSWVDENGNLTNNVDTSIKIDVSSTADPVSLLGDQIYSLLRNNNGTEVTYLSFAKCGLKAVPKIFHFENREGKRLHSMVEYVTFFGNDFASISRAGEFFREDLNATDALVVARLSSVKWPETVAWAAGFTTVTLSELKELDLRKCSIQHVPDNTFGNMPQLQALYLGENFITTIGPKAFYGLPNLQYLDLSRNQPNKQGLSFINESVFSPLLNLKSLDLSFTVIQQKDALILQYLSNTLQSLSICYSALSTLPAGVFSKTQLKYLDVSGNSGLLSSDKPLDGLQRKLEVIYAKDLGLKTLEIFKKFVKLQILDVEANEVKTVKKATAETLKSLQALNLDNNIFGTWLENKIFSSMPKLKFLSLAENNINFISEEMMEDLKNINYIGITCNFIVCNCFAREAFEIAYRNQKYTSFLKSYRRNSPFLFHHGFRTINTIIKTRNEISRNCEQRDDKYCKNDDEILIESEGNFTFFDFKVSEYSCLSATDAVSTPFSNIRTCVEMKSKGYFEDVIYNSKLRLIFLLMVPALVFPTLIFLYIFRRNLKYFCIMMKNSATLSLINSDKAIDDGTIFHYDVFVSYCNGDRNWVLDHLLPHVEKDCNVSVCLHERDFQVGISILENIASCMDRSRCIMLVLSRQFLASQWCQFEMHLAQHRLLETRREDLVLVLLEEIPRRIRPTTLHYLMLTKTYIVWPQKEGEHASFWKRLSRSLLSNSRIVRDNTSTSFA